MTGFSNQWDDIYKNGQQMSSWPWSDLVSLVFRHCKNLIGKNNIKVLELGCGAGANIHFFQSLGMTYFGIDGSLTIVNMLRNRFPDIANSLMVGDFTEGPYPLTKFDLVIDRAAVTHNSEAQIKKTIATVDEILSPEGVFIGVDWFSTEHTDMQYGEIAEDIWTRNNFTEGQFLGVGRVHFSNEEHLREIFSNFKILSLEKKVTTKYEPKNNHQFASWNVVVKK